MSTTLDKSPSLSLASASQAGRTTRSSMGAFLASSLASGRGALVQTSPHRFIEAGTVLGLALATSILLIGAFGVHLQTAAVPTSFSCLDQPAHTVCVAKRQPGTAGIVID